MKSIIIILVFIFIYSSCVPILRIKHNNVITNDFGFDTNCFVCSKHDIHSFKKSKENCQNIFKFNVNDTIASIGSGSGWREFQYSIYTDSLVFYLEDIDTSCLTINKINNIYLPHYAEIKGSPITNKFMVVSGTDKTIDIDANKVDKVLIFNSYHHFTDEKAMINECKRILKKNGKLIIQEQVVKKNKFTHRFCPLYGRFYKSESNFVNDIECSGFKVDSVYKIKSIYKRGRLYRKDKHARIFVFNKL